MTQQQKDELNKELCGLLGICWHVPRKEIFIKNDKMECGKCCQWLRIRPARDENELTGGYEFVNSDFTSDAGKIRLLRELKNTKDWYFYAVKLINEVYLLDETGKLAIAARDFLKAMEAKE